MPGFLLRVLPTNGKGTVVEESNAKQSMSDKGIVVRLAIIRWSVLIGRLQAARHPVFFLGALLIIRSF